MPTFLIAAALAVAPPAPGDDCARALVRPTAAAGAPPARTLGQMPPAYLDARGCCGGRMDCEVTEVRQASGAWTNVPTGPALRAFEPARKSP